MATIYMPSSGTPLSTLAEIPLTRESSAASIADATYLPDDPFDWAMQGASATLLSLRALLPEGATSEVPELIPVDGAQETTTWLEAAGSLPDAAYDALQNLGGCLEMTALTAAGYSVDLGFTLGAGLCGVMLFRAWQRTNTNEHRMAAHAQRDLCTEQSRGLSENTRVYQLGSAANVDSTLAVRKARRDAWQKRNTLFQQFLDIDLTDTLDAPLSWLNMHYRFHSGFGQSEFVYGRPLKRRAVRSGYHMLREYAFYKWQSTDEFGDELAPWRHKAKCHGRRNSGYFAIIGESCPLSEGAIERLPPDKKMRYQQALRLMEIYVHGPPAPANAASFVPYDNYCHGAPGRKVACRNNATDTSGDAPRCADCAGWLRDIAAQQQEPRRQRLLIGCKIIHGGDPAPEQSAPPFDPDFVANWEPILCHGLLTAGIPCINHATDFTGELPQCAHCAASGIKLSSDQRGEDCIACEVALNAACERRRAMSEKWTQFFRKVERRRICHLKDELAAAGLVPILAVTPLDLQLRIVQFSRMAQTHISAKCRERKSKKKRLEEAALGIRTQGRARDDAELRASWVALLSSMRCSFMVPPVTNALHLRALQLGRATRANLHLLTRPLEEPTPFQKMKINLDWFTLGVVGESPCYVAQVQWLERYLDLPPSQQEVVDEVVSGVWGIFNPEQMKLVFTTAAQPLAVAREVGKQLEKMILNRGLSPVAARYLEPYIVFTACVGHPGSHALNLVDADAVRMLMGGPPSGRD